MRSRVTGSRVWGLHFRGLPFNETLKFSTHALGKWWKSGRMGFMILNEKSMFLVKGFKEKG